MTETPVSFWRKITQKILHKKGQQSKNAGFKKQARQPGSFPVVSQTVKDAELLITKRRFFRWKDLWEKWSYGPQERWEAVRKILLEGDLGTVNSEKIVKKLQGQLDIKKKAQSQEVFLEALSGVISEEMKPYEVVWPLPWLSPLPKGAVVVLVMGVNGVGKSTTIGKMVRAVQQERLGKTLPQMALVGADTFRSGALEQLGKIGNFLQVPVYGKAYGASPGAAAFEGVGQALDQGATLIFVDTAGRLHNHVPLMDELFKIEVALNSLFQKRKDVYPETTVEQKNILIVDGTTGQNTCAQAEVFLKTFRQRIQGVIMTKLDGVFGGGALMPIAQQLKTPILALGIGESMDDLEAFSAEKYSYHLVYGPDLAFSRK